MLVRAKIALTIFATGLVTAVLVIATVWTAFGRYERETVFERAAAFLDRITQNYDRLLEHHERQPQEFNAFLRNLVLYEPDTQLYLLDATGRVLSSTGDAVLPPEFRVALGPVQAATVASLGQGSVVLGDDPERMDAHAVVAARALRKTLIRADEPISGYLYVVCHKPSMSGWSGALGRSGAWGWALGLIVAIVGVMTLFAALIIVAVTKPLRQLTQAVATLSREGLEGGAQAALALPKPSADEFGRLSTAFGMLIDNCRAQWGALRRLDQFRREGVSNLSHDLRSPLTATVACLETLEARWQGQLERTADLALAEIALRNTRNAAKLVQSLGDLAKLDEPSFALQREVVDLGEMVADIALRFAERAARGRVELIALLPPEDSAPAVASVDVELFERAVANVIDNALKFCPPGARITLDVQAGDAGVDVCIADTGPGIAADDLPHVFDRFYQTRQSVAPATGEGGKGLGLAIVRRIAELHGGSVKVLSTVGQGTTVVLRWPSSPAVFSG